MSYRHVRIREAHCVYCGAVTFITWASVPRVCYQHRDLPALDLDENGRRHRLPEPRPLVLYPERHRREMVRERVRFGRKVAQAEAEAAFA